MAMSRTQPAPRSRLVPQLIGAAWVLAIIAQATGTARLLHHHALLVGGPPIWLGTAAFLLGWQVMVAAMMLPASLPTIWSMAHASASRASGRLWEAPFLGAFALVWTIFGAWAFAGDYVIHHIVDTTPWLAARPGLIEGIVLATAGAYQVTPVKRRSLAVCRHPAGLLAIAGPDSGPFRLGFEHALTCLGSSWALMVLMFAEGFASVGWMAALTGVMVYEATGRRGQPVASATGVVLLLAGGAILVGAVL
jgi:predicted metal-binding membrane protein